MINKNTFAILGGDKRQLSLAQSLYCDGNRVLTFGLENADFSDNIQKVNLSDAIYSSNYIIFPLPLTIDNKSLNAPYSNNCLLLTDEFCRMLIDKIIFCGLSQRIKEYGNNWERLNLYDYTLEEDFSIRNAIPTSEGAIQLAMENFCGTINGSNCLVAGFGRIGKVLSKMLSSLGANVSVSARKESDLSWINILGYRPIFNSNIINSGNYDIIFNTVPHMIFDEKTLSKIANNSLLIDLASKPGGTDFNAASKLGIHSIHALSLPGKVAPDTSGKIVKDVIYRMIEEVI